MNEESRITPEAFIAVTKIHKEAVQMMQESLIDPSPHLLFVIRYLDGTIDRMREIQNEKK